MARKPAAKAEIVKTAASSRPKRNIPKKASPKKPAAKPVAKPAAKRAVTKKKAPVKGKKASRVVGKSKSGSKTHPTYARMISKALQKFATPHKGIGYRTIANYIQDNYPVKENYTRYLKQALATGLESGIFARTLASYRLSPKGRAVLEGKRKLKTTKKKTTTTDAEGTEKKKRTTKEQTDSPSKSKRSRSASKEKDSPKKKRDASESPKKKRASPKKRAEPAVAGKRAAPAANKGARVAKGRKAAVESSDDDNNVPVFGGGAFEGANANAVNVAGSKFDHFWQFKDNDGSWGNYEVKASDVLEEVYQGYLANRGDTDVRAVKSGQWEYQVDFMAMKQTNIQHPNHTVRDIRRVANASNNS